MSRFILFALLFCIHINPGISSLKQAKSFANEVYTHHRYTFFCKHPFSDKGLASLHLCQNCPREEIKIHWMQLVPSWEFGKHLLCWREKMCIDKHGKPYGGPRCCHKISHIYQTMEKDVHNLVPEIPYVKRKRKNYRFGNVGVLTENYDECYLQIDKKKKMIEPSAQIKGMIARTYLYMQHHYGIILPEDQKELFYQWHLKYPPSRWERARSRKIMALQGNGNPFIQG